MKLLKKFFFKIWFDTTTERPIGFHSQQFCVECPYRPKNQPMLKGLQGLIMADMDMDLPQPEGQKPKDIIEAHAEVLVYEPVKKK